MLALNTKRAQRFPIWSLQSRHRHRLVSARGPPLREDCDAQMGEGVEIEPGWDMAAQPAPYFDGDPRVNLCLGETAIQQRCGGPASGVPRAPEITPSSTAFWLGLAQVAHCCGNRKGFYVG